jgi:Predicted flavoprotein
MKILAFAGSNSSKSINRELIKICCKHLKTHFHILELQRYQIPMFSEDEERKNGFPTDLWSLYNTLKSSDAYLISIPEHNGNFPAFFKNILDWLSRIDRRFFSAKPIFILNASPGNTGDRVLQIAQSTFEYFKGRVIQSLSVKGFGINQYSDENQTLIKASIEQFEQICLTTSKHSNQ